MTRTPGDRLAQFVNLLDDTGQNNLSTHFSNALPANPTIGLQVRVTDRDLARFKAVTPGSEGTPDGYGLIAGTGADWLLVERGDINARWMGLTGVGTETDAFYAAVTKAIADDVALDLNGLDITLSPSSTYTINSSATKFHIKNGTVRFTQSAQLNVFTLVAAKRVRLDSVVVVGNSNGTIDDSFDATTGTYTLFRAALTADQAVKNFELVRCDISGLIVADDDKIGATVANSFFVKTGEVTRCKIHDVPGHAFSFNMWDGIKIHHNEFENIGALCADFGHSTKNCKMVYNDIDGAAGIGKTQTRNISGTDYFPQRNEISDNNAVNLTSGNASNVAVVKSTGINDQVVRNTVVYEGGTAVESFEIFGSCRLAHNYVERTLNKTRSYVSTQTGPVGNPRVVIENNRGTGMLHFARLQHTSPMRVSITNNRDLSDLQRLVFGEANLNSPGLDISHNGADTSAFTGTIAIQFASSTVSLARLKLAFNTIKSDNNCANIWVAEGATIVGNSLESVSGSNLVMISTTSFTVTGNASNQAWGTTSAQQIYSGNTVF